MPKQEDNLSESKQSKFESHPFPKCINQKQARLVCLQSTCNTYAFFCALCDDQTCEKQHQHQDKILSIGFKEFIRRVFKQRKPTEKLSNSITGYRTVLQTLRKDVDEFVDKQMQNLDQIILKASSYSPEDGPLIQKLKEHNYLELTGTQMDHLWAHADQTAEKIRTEEELSEFIKIKAEQVKGISQHFEHLNKLELDKIEDDNNELQKPVNNAQANKSQSKSQVQQDKDFSNASQNNNP